MSSLRGPLRVGVGGPVGSGKTALVERLCKKMRDDYDIAVVTNDIYTKEDAEFLTRAGALAPERIMGVETGGCPHTAIREDASINLAAVSDIVRKWPGLENEQMIGPGDLAVTTDYRDVLSEVLVKRLNNPATNEIFPGYSPNMINLLK